MSNILTNGELLLNLLSFQPIAESSEKPDLRLRRVERAHIKMVLVKCSGNKSHAARELGISLNTLYNRLHLYGFDEGEARPL